MVDSGVIVLWHGSVETIPAGWHLCDGDAGTPDLRDRFLIGASAGLPPDSTGGTTNHNHDFTTDGHKHQLIAGPDIAWGFDYAAETNTNTDSGTTDLEDNLPPYYALAYIMRV